MLTMILIMMNLTTIVKNNENTREVDSVNVNICIENTNTKALVDSGSVCTTINKRLPNAVVLDCKQNFGCNHWRCRNSKQ